MEVPVSSAFLSERGLHTFNYPNKFGLWCDVATGNKYSTTNPQGIVDIGMADNDLCEDILLQKFSEDKMIEVEPFMLYYGPFPGMTSFREALAHFIKDRFKSRHPILGENILVTSGAGAGLDLLAHAIGDPGDYFLHPSPCYTRIQTDMAERSAVKSVNVPLSSKLEEGDTVPFQLTVQKIEDALRQAVKQKSDLVFQGKNVRAIVLINPHNPTGDVYSLDLVYQILQFAHRHKLHVIMDEVYALSVWDQQTEFESYLQIPNIPDPMRTHLVWSFSKDFGLSGYRVGIIHSWNKQIIDCLKSLTYFGSVPPVLQHRLQLFISDTKWLDEVYFPTSLQRMRDAYNYCCDFFRLLGVKAHPGKATYFLWADFSKYVTPLTHEAELVLFEKFMKAGIFTMPGQFFFLEEAGWFRIVFTHNKTLLDEGLKRIKSVLETLDVGDLSQSEEQHTAATQDSTTTGSSVAPLLDKLEIIGVEDGASGGDLSLEDLVLNLKQNIKSSNWLKDHTADKWEKENPDLAKTFHKAREDQAGKKQ